ncbi:helix-turn-helix domain-containing protein [Bradyrhizobium diazoefficiens]
MSYDEKKSNFKPATIIESPDGILFQATQGNKWKFNRAVQRDSTGTYSKLQKQLMTILIDSTNEGYGDDRSKWGYAYPSYVTLAAECGCTAKAAKENIQKLEEKGAVTVLRAAGERASGKKGRGGGGGRNKPNRYFLHGWNEFGCVENGNPQTVTANHRMEKTVTAKRGNGNGHAGNGNSRAGNGARWLPDSSSLPTSSTHLKNTHMHFASLSGAGSFVDEADGRSISTSDCMSARQQFHFLKHLYERKFGRPVSESTVLEGDEDEDQVPVDGNWKAFREASGQVHFTLAMMNIEQAGPGHSFADCVSGKAWTPEHDDPEDNGDNIDCEDDPPF